MSDQANSETEIDLNFVETINLLNKHNIPYWVCHGTLLGLIRDGRLIPWDHDIDIAIWAGSVSKEAIIDLMVPNGYILKSDGSDYDFLSFTKQNGREVDFNFYRVSQDQSLAYSEWFIPRSRFTSLLGVLANARTRKGRYAWFIRRIVFLSPFFRWVVAILKKNMYFYKSAGYTTPVDLFNKFKFVEVSGLKVSVPFSYEKVLEYVYGMDWHIPKRQYDWTKESPSTRISNSRF